MMNKDMEKEKNDTDSESIDTNEAIEELFGFQFEQMMIIEEHDIDDTNNRSSSILPRIEVEEVELPPNCYRRTSKKKSASESIVPPTAFYLHNILDAKECENLVQIADKTPRGFQYIKEATHTNPNDGSAFTVPLLNPHPHKLSLFQNHHMVELIWSRLQPILDAHLSKEFIQHFGPPLGLNPRLRVLRYDASDMDFFSPHYDATTTSTDKSNHSSSQEENIEIESQLTVLLYLNEGFDGGRTLFLDRSDTTRNIQPINPRQGSILLFDHGLYHSGEAVNSKNGTKFILRTDVMFASPHNTKISLNGQASKSFSSLHSSNCYREKNGNPKKNLTSVQSTSFLQDEPQQKTSFNTIHEICLKINMSTNDIEMLKESDFLDSTIHSFCEPGRAMITMILQESTLIPKESIDLLVKTSFEIMGVTT